jgi:hypothetical protein
MTIRQAIQNVIDHCPMEYAVQYAENINESWRLFGEHGVYFQVRYILTNIVDIDPEYEEPWTGELAEETIATLQNYEEGNWKKE